MRRNGQIYLTLGRNAFTLVRLIFTKSCSNFTIKRLYPKQRDRLGRKDGVRPKRD